MFADVQVLSVFVRVASKKNPARGVARVARSLCSFFVFSFCRRSNQYQLRSIKSELLTWNHVE